MQMMHTLPLPGVPEKMFLSKKGAYLTKKHFFWDTLYYYKIQYNVFKSLKTYLFQKVIRVRPDQQAPTFQQD